MLVDADDDSSVPLRCTTSPVNLRSTASQNRRSGREDPLAVLDVLPLCSLRGQGSYRFRLHTRL